MEGAVTKRVKRKNSAFYSSGRKKSLLNEIAKRGQLMTALEKVGIPHQTHYQWLKDDEVYAADYEAARDMIAASMESEVYHRAVIGDDKPIGFHQGQHGGMFIKEKSDNLLMFGLKGLKPDVYRDNYNVDVNVKVEAVDARTQLAAMTERNPDLARLIHELLPQQSDAIIDADVVEVLPGDVDESTVEEGGTPPNSRDDVDQ